MRKRFGLTLVRHHHHYIIRSYSFKSLIRARVHLACIYICVISRSTHFAHVFDKNLNNLLCYFFPQILFAIQNNQLEPQQQQQQQR